MGAKKAEGQQKVTLSNEAGNCYGGIRPRSSRLTMEGRVTNDTRTIVMDRGKVAHAFRPTRKRLQLSEQFDFRSGKGSECDVREKVYDPFDACSACASHAS
jgi:hypothetical protein